MHYRDHTLAPAGVVTDSEEPDIRAICDCKDFGGNITHWTLWPFLTKNVGLVYALRAKPVTGTLYGATFTLHTEGSCLADADMVDAGLLVVTGTQLHVTIVELIAGIWLLAIVTVLLAVLCTLSRLAEEIVTGNKAALLTAEVAWVTILEQCRTSVAQTVGLLTSCKFCSTGKMLPWNKWHS